MKMLNRYAIEVTNENLDGCIKAFAMLGVDIASVSVEGNKYLIIYKSNIKYSKEYLLEVYNHGSAK